MVLFIKAISVTICYLIYCFLFFCPGTEGPVGISSVCICQSLYLIGPVVAIILFLRYFLQLVFKMGQFVFPLYTVWNKSFPGSSDGKETACSVGNPGSIPGLRRSPGEGKGYPLQYSCLENSMERGAWWVTVHGVTKTLTQLSNYHPPPPQKNTQFEMCLCSRLYFFRCWAIDSQGPKVHEREAKGDLTVEPWCRKRCEQWKRQSWDF